MPLEAYPVRSQYRSDGAAQLVARPVDALLTVSTDANSLLNDLGITTVFDLGASILFDTARRIVEAADPAADGAGNFIGADVLDTGDRGKTPADLADSPVTVLRQVGDATATELETKLGTATIRELAAWPAYQAARTIINDAYGLAPSIVGDAERPDDLIPVARRYATERVNYDIIVMDRVLENTRQPITVRGVEAPARSASARDLVSSGGIDVGDLVSASLVAKPAVGAVLSYRQSWFPQGLALGQLLHSMALAPGESTRVAMIDWNRAVRATAAEDTTQSEALVASVERTRAMREVTSAVATEAQTGFSRTSSTAHQEQAGQSFGMSGVLPWGVFSEGSSESTSTSTTSASGWASSAGERTLNADMRQNITDRTHQAANSVRNRRATAVTETSQQESETLTTRVVTNYNHMHALTMQYFEVVQVYRIVVELARVTRCIFVPMKLVTFSPEVLRRYRSVIAAAGLIPEVRALSGAQGRSLVVRAPNGQGGWDPSWLALAEQAIGDSIGAASEPDIYLPMEGLRVWSIIFSDRGLLDHFDAVEVHSRQGGVYSATLQEDVGYMGGGCGAAINNSFEPRDFSRIVLQRKEEQEEPFEGTFTAGIRFDVFDASGSSAAADSLDVPSLIARTTVEVRSNASDVTVFSFAQIFADADVVDHLEQNALHYSSAIWRALDAATITTLLSSYEFEERRLIEVIDPVPVSVTGNYVVFRLYGGEGDAGWQDFLRRHDLLAPVPEEDLIPLPSSGVFAEAVLGRSNSAEQLDITRFWNWEDSPIPILPPEINPLTAGGRADDATPQTGNLESPVVNIQNAPPLPDPAGLAPLYAAIANGNMFRDMSGLAQVAALAGTTMGSAQAGAGQAMSAAGSAQQVAANLFRDVLEIAVQAALAAAGIPPIGGLGGGGSTGGGASALPQTPTNLGAVLGAAKELDEAEAAASDPGEWMAYPGELSGDGEGPLSPPPLIDAPDDKSKPAVPVHQSAILHGTTPKPRTSGGTSGSGTGSQGATRPQTRQRIVRIFSTYPGTNKPVAGLYELNFQDPISNVWDSDYVTVTEQNPIGRLDILLPAGNWSIIARIAASLPEMLGQVPVNVIPGIDPITVTVSQQLQSSPIPVQAIGSVNVSPSAKQVDVRLEAVVEEVNVTRTIELSTTSSAQASAEVSAGLEAEVSGLVAGAKASGQLTFGVQFALSGTVGQTISYTMSYKRLKEFKFVQQ